MKRGRVIVQFKTNDGKPILKDTTNKNQLLKVIGQTIEKFKEKPVEAGHTEERKKRRKKK